MSVDLDTLFDGLEKSARISADTTHSNMESYLSEASVVLANAQQMREEQSVASELEAVAKIVPFSEPPKETV